MIYDVRLLAGVAMSCTEWFCEPVLLAGDVGTVALASTGNINKHFSPTP
jgi:hypothetical protein